jgi:hypothetical protein
MGLGSLSPPFPHQSPQAYPRRFDNTNNSAVQQASGMVGEPVLPVVARTTSRLGRVSCQELETLDKSRYHVPE